MVGVTAGAVLIVNRHEHRDFGSVRRTPLIERVVETFVADVAGQHGTFAARGDGQW